MSYSAEYTDRIDPNGNQRSDPLVEIKIILDEGEKSVIAYADTGCDVALSLPKRFATKFKFPDEAVVFESTAINADGSPSPILIYRLKIRIEGLPEADMYVSVSQDEVEFDDTEGVMSLDEPLLGRAIFDKYEVLFSGKSSPRRLSLS